MTNAELLAKFKVEIERLKADYNARVSSSLMSGRLLYMGKVEALNEVLCAIDTLESGKPMNPEDAMKELDEKIALVKQRGTWDGVDVDKYMDEVRGREPEKPVPNDLDFEQELYNHFGQIKDFTLGMRIGKYFYELGKQSGSSEIPNDLEEAAGEYEKEHTYQRYDGGGLTPEYDATLAEAFIAGYNLCKEQMMKEARNHFVLRVLSDNTTKKMIELYNDEVDCKFGDVVRIIIVKEDEK